MRLSIRWKMILTLGVPLVLLNAVLLRLDYQASRGEMMTLLQAQVAERATGYADRFNVRLAAVEQAAHAAAADLQSRRGLSPEVVGGVLSAALLQNRWVASVSVVLEPELAVWNPAGAALDRLETRPTMAGGDSGDASGGASGGGDGGDVRRLERLREVLERRADVTSRRAAMGAERGWLERRRYLAARRVDRGNERPWVIEDWTSSLEDPAQVGAQPDARVGLPAWLAEAEAGGGAGAGAVSVPEGGRGVWLATYRHRRLDDVPVATYVVPLLVDGHAEVAGGAPGGAEPSARRVGVVAVSLPLIGLRDMLGAVGEDVAEFTIVDRGGRFVSHAEPRLLAGASVVELARDAGHALLAEVLEQLVEAGEVGVSRVDNLHLLNPRFEEDAYYWLAYAPIRATDWVFGTAIPEELIVGPVTDRLVQRARGQALQGVMILLLAVLISIRITRPIQRLVEGVERVERGELDARVEGVSNHDEIGVLAEGFNRMTGRLRAQLEALTAQRVAREKVEGELRVARNIQNSLLPRTFPPFPERAEFDLHAVNIAARRVAGDFFDFFFVDEDRLIVIIADVSGKGVPAAMLMAVARTIVRNWANAGYTVDRIVERANAMIHMDNPSSMFVTLFLAEYRPSSGALSYVNAGHCLPFLVDTDGSVSKFGEVTAPLVGVAEAGEMGGFERRDGRLEPGQTLFLYTDGVIEARSKGNLMLEEQGAMRMLAAHRDGDARAMCEGMITDVKRFQDDEPIDDITVLALRRC